MTDESSRPKTIAERRFAEEASALEALDLAGRFERMYETNLWSGSESRSGVGSSLAATARLRAELPRLLHSLDVRRLLDVPCGDFHWMSRVDLSGIEYVGGDIVRAAVEANQARHGGRDRRFVVADLTTGPLPAGDAIFCRDCLVHFSFVNIAQSFRVMRSSGASWLLATTFTGPRDNADVTDGDWRPLNLEMAPFHLPSPVATINEECTEEGGAYADKSIGVWRIDDLPTEIQSE